MSPTPPDHDGPSLPNPAELRSYPSLEKRFWIITVLSSMTAYVCVVIAADLIAKSFVPFVADGVVVGTAGTVGAALLAGAARLAYVPRAFLKITLRPDGLAFDRDGRIFDIPFAQITGLSLRAGPALFSRLRLMLADGRRVDVNLAIAGIERAAEAILVARPGLLPKDREETLLRRLAFANHRAARAYDLPSGWLLLFIVKYAIFPIVFGVLVPNLVKSLIEHDLYLWRKMWYFPQNHFVIPAVAVVALAGAAGIALNIARELLLSAHERRSQAATATAARDLALERRSRALFTALFFAGGLLFYAAVLYKLMTP